MKRRTVIIGLVFSLFFLASCQYIPGGGGQPEVPSTYGIEVEFLQDIPPTTLYDSESVSFQLKVSNRGGYTTTPTIYLTGHDDDFVSGISNIGVRPDEEVIGIDEYNPQGGETYVDFRNIRFNIGSIDNYPFSLMARAVYQYKTEAYGTICMDPNWNKPSEADPVCRVQQFEFFPGQAPVQVQLLEVRPQPRSSSFKFQVTHSRRGANDAPFDPFASLTEGRGVLEYDIKDLVLVEKVTVGKSDVTASCKGLVNDQYVRLASGSLATFTCDAVIKQDTAYNSPITVTLRYNYLSTTTKRFKVYKLLR